MDSSPQTVFTIKTPKKSSLWDNILGKKPKENSIIAINNLFASKALAKITSSDIQNIASTFKVDLRKDFLPDLLSFYKSYLLYCLNDNHLSNQEVQELYLLRKTLSLNDEEVEVTHREVIDEIYKKQVDKVLEDRRVSDEERKMLKEVQKSLRISDSDAERIYMERASLLINRFMEEALSDNLLTDGEEKELEEIKASLSIDLFMECTSRAHYEKCKLLWQIETGNLPVVDTDFFCDEGEICHMNVKAEWLEQKCSHKKRAHDLNQKLIQGSHWKLENREMKPELNDIWAVMDNGKINITNQRIILAGTEGEKSILLEHIVDFTPYINGVNIIEQDKSVFVQFKDHIDVFAMILGKVIQSVHSRN